MQKGLFITLEGGDGCGKTTQLAWMQNYLKNKGIELVTTREPGGTPLAEKIRDVVLAHGLEPVAIDTEMLLFFASRAQHLAEVIKPAIDAGKWVICSRFTDSTYAYQSGGRQMDPKRIEVLEEWVHGNFQPDLTFLFDLPVEIGLARTKERAELDRFEVEDLAFFERVRKAYLKRAQKSDRYKIINANQSIASVHEDIRVVLDGKTR